MGLYYRAIGQRIKKYRKQRQLSQLMLSEMIEKSPTYVSYIESGRKSMSLETFVRIANALEVPADVLLAEQLTSNNLSTQQEFSLLLSDCTDFEKYTIIRTAKSLKSILRENKLFSNHNDH